jgi:hypothetical protein
MESRLPSGPHIQKREADSAGFPFLSTTHLFRKRDTTSTKIVEGFTGVHKMLELQKPRFLSDLARDRRKSASWGRREELRRRS